MLIIDQMNIINLLTKISTIYGPDTKINDVLQMALDKSNYIDVYADGSSYYNGSERLSGIGVFFGDNDERNISKLIDGTNNNESEIIACIEALKVIQGKKYYVNMYTDSKLVVDGMNGLCSLTKFSDLFLELKELSNFFVNINWIHVAGHSGIYGNEKADELSRQKYGCC